MTVSKKALESLSQGMFLPQEEMLEVARKKGKLFIGVPKEIAFQENRVPIVPDAVALLVNNGHRVLIEAGAGKASRFQDADYSEAGAEICYDTAEVYKANIILKVAPPTLEEIDMMQHKQTLISALQITVQPKDYIKKLMAKKVSAIAWDYIMDDEGIFTIVRTMGEIAGNTSILVAAEYLSNKQGGQGLMFGGISGVEPSRVVILGAGTVGEYAARAALGLGATVKVFDNSISKLRRLQNDIGRPIFTSTINPNLLERSLQNADVAIGAIRATNGRSPCVVSDNMVRQMKEGSIVVDVSIDQGGCFETSEVTSHSKPVFSKYGVIHYCVPNIASRVSKTSSFALSNVFSSIMMEVGGEGSINNMIKTHNGVRNAVYLYNGILTNEFLGETFNIPYKNINLLIAAF